MATPELGIEPSPSRLNQNKRNSASLSPKGLFATGPFGWALPQLATAGFRVPSVAGERFYPPVLSHQQPRHHLMQDLAGVSCQPLFPAATAVGAVVDLQLPRQHHLFRCLEICLDLCLWRHLYFGVLRCPPPSYGRSRLREACPSVRPCCPCPLKAVQEKKPQRRKPDRPNQKILRLSFSWAVS